MIVSHKETSHDVEDSNEQRCGTTTNIANTRIMPSQTTVSQLKGESNPPERRQFSDQRDSACQMRGMSRRRYHAGHKVASADNCGHAPKKFP